MSDKTTAQAKNMAVLTPELAIDRASMMLRDLAKPVEAGEHTDPQIRRAAIRAGIAYGRARRIWYREARQILAHEYDLIIRANLNWRRESDERHQNEMAQFRLQYGDFLDERHT